MRAFAGLIAAVLVAAAPAAAEPRPGEGYTLTVFTKPGAVFAGLARDGDDLLFTDLGDGRLYRLTPGGKPRAFGPILPHGIDVIGDPTGPYRIARHGDRYLVAEGWTPVAAEETPNDHAILEVDEAGAIRIVGNDFWNPYDFVADGDTIYVVDAARNSIERIDADGGGRATVFSFHRLSQGASTLKRLSPTEFSGDKPYEFDAVPTGIALRDRRLYVSLFAGFPYLAGSGKVVSIPLGGEALRLEVDNLNAPVDVAFDADGGLVVLEHGIFDQATGFQPGTGRLLAIDATSGQRHVLLDGMTRPVAVLPFTEETVVVSELGGSLHFLKPGH